MANDDSDSSLDGGLQDFLRQHGIGMGDFDVSTEGASGTFGGDVCCEIAPAVKSSRGVAAELQHLVPSVHKVTQMLHSQGFDPLRWSESDVDAFHKVSVFVVDGWAASLLTCLEELTVRLDTQQSAVKDASLSSRKTEVSTAALETRVQILQDKLLEAERKLKLSEANLAKKEESISQKAKSKKSDDGDSRRVVRGLEEKVEESERRVRQRDLEIERLKDKLRHIVEKERDANVRHREVLSNISRSSVGSHASSRDESFSSASSYTSTSPSSKNNVSGAKSSAASKNKMLPIPPIVNDMIEALEIQRDGLERRNAELEEQVHDLQGALRDQENGDRVFSARAREVESASSESASESDSPTVRSMYDKIKEQSRKIDLLNRRAEAHKAAEYDAVQLQEQLRRRSDELVEELENVRIELESRPSARQWADKQRELADAENKLHDLVMMRGEAAELAAWRKHLSTSDRIKVDKRNHELGLWLLDSLPKAVTKEVLQTVCRELDVSDISDIQPSLAKLKAVVKAVPRMERFITQVCEYLFERDRQIRELGGGKTAGKDRPTMEDVLPVLQSWWLDLQNNFNLSAFQNKVLTEMRRRDRLLAQEQGAGVLQLDDYTADQWPERERAVQKSLEVIRDLVDFQVETFRHKKSFRAAEDFIKDNPDAMVNRQVAHIQYLFNINSLEGLLPRMNSVYLFGEEMKNFLTSAKISLGLAPTTPDSIVVNEICKMLSVWEAEMANFTNRKPKMILTAGGTKSNSEEMWNDPFPEHNWLCGGYVSGNASDSSGAYGVVKKGKHRATGESCVLKIMNPSTSAGKMTMSDFNRELRIGEYISEHFHQDKGMFEHHSLLRLFDGWVEKEVVIDGQTYVSGVFVVESLTGGDMFAEIKRQIDGNLDYMERMLRQAIKPVFQAVLQLHNHRIVHLDLKAENLVFRDLSREELVIIDYGLAYQLQWSGEEQMSLPALQALHYYPAEVHSALGRGQPFPMSPAIDVYCLGLCLYVYVNGHYRYRTYPNCWRTECGALEFRRHAVGDCIDGKQIVQVDVATGVATFADGTTVPPLVSPEVIDLIISMLRVDPKKRVTMQQVLKHAWFSVPASQLQGKLGAVPGSDEGTPRRHSIDLHMAGSASPLLQAQERYDQITIRDDVESLKVTIGDIKASVLKRLATDLKKLRASHPGQDVGCIVQLNCSEFERLFHDAGLPFLATKRIFDAIDFDRNAALDYRELTLLLKISGLFSSRDILTHFSFPLLDSDDSQSISREEFACHLGEMILQVSPPSTPSGPDAVETEGSSLSLRRPDSKIMTESGRFSQDALDHVLNVIDSSGDSQVQLDEFLQFAFSESTDLSVPAGVAHRFLFGLLMREGSTSSSNSPRSPRSPR